jgi:hypothetical protein
MTLEERLGARPLRLLGLLGALALATAAAWPLLATPGIVNTRAGGDSPFLLQRVYELQVNLRAGVFPARWMPNAAYGLGYPFFNYYASLPFYLAAALSLAGAGILWAIKLTQLIGFLGAAAAMYGLVSDLVDDSWAAFLAAAAYTFAPFHMVNVYVRGDSLSEFYAFVFYALIAWAIVRLRRSPTVGHVAFLATAYGGLVVTHTVSAMIFSPLAGLALLWATLTASATPDVKRQASSVRVLLAGAGALLLALALSAWYWLPALLEQDAVSLADMTTGYFHYSGHFRWRDLVQPSLLFDYRLDASRTPFALGGLQVGLTVAGLLVVAASWLQQRLTRWLDLGLVALLAYAIWPITPSSALIWSRLPLLPMAQFPWRFLSIAALATALVAGVALSRLGRLCESKATTGERVTAAGRVTPPLLAMVLAVALAISALAQLRPEPLPLREGDVSAGRLQLYEHLTGNIGSTVRAEYLPAGAIPRPFSSAALLAGQPHPPPVAREGELDRARLLSAGPTEQVWEVTVGSRQAQLVFQTYAFPGWQATVDGQPVAIDPAAANGRIVVPVEQGRHEVTLRLGLTPLRAAAERTSLLAGLVVLALALAGLWRARQHWRRLVVAAAIAAVTFGTGALLGALATGAEPSPGLATETMDYIQMPYLHPNPQGVAFGQTKLVGYELTQEAGPGDTLRLRLHWESTGDQALRAVVRLTTAAEPLFRAPPLAVSEAALSIVTEHAFIVPPEVAPGLALLAVEVWGPEGLLIPHTPQGTRLGTTYLAPVRIRPPEPGGGVAPIARLGKSLDLLQATVEEAGRHRLLVRLIWRPAVRLAEDYVTSVRLWDPAGHQLPGAALDMQPRYGLYPTSLWPAGTPVADFYELPVPAGTPPGPGYQLEVTLYQARTLAPVGSIRLPGVTLSRPTVDPGVHVLQMFEGGLGLTAWQVEREEVEDGEEVTARLQWTARSTPLPDATARLSLHDGSGREVTASESEICPHYPPSVWPLHAVVNGQLRLHVPPGTPPGTYTLRLALRDGAGRPLGAWSPAGDVRVRTSQRHTTVPDFAHPLGVEFGGLIRLPGYDLERTKDGLVFTFHWQAIRAPGRDYKVFVHCLDATGDAIVAQRDAMPLGDTYPTGRWAAGEVVSDRLVLDMRHLPKGRYQIAMGWYEPRTGERLEPVGGQAPISDRRVLLLVVDWP